MMVAYLRNAKILFHKILVRPKWRIVTLQLGRLADAPQSRDQVNTWNHSSPAENQWEECSISLAIFLPRMQNLNLIIKKYKIKLRDILQSEWPVLFKSVKVRKDKRRLRTDWRRPKSQKTRHKPRFITQSFSNKKIILDNWKNLNGSVGQMTVIYSSYLPDLSDMLWLFRRIPLFIGDIHQHILG